MTVFWDVTLCSLVEVYRRFRAIALMEAATASETSVNFYIPEDGHLLIYYNGNKFPLTNVALSYKQYYTGYPLIKENLTAHKL
jgi:hypothetical protein